MDTKEMQKTGEEIVKRGRGRPKGTGGNERPDTSLTPTEPGYNSAAMQRRRLLLNLAKKDVDMSNFEQVAQRVDEYFDICEQQDIKASVEGLAFVLGIDRTYLWELRVGRKGKNEEVANLLKKTCEFLNFSLVDDMQNGKINPIPALFLLKNNHGYADKQEFVLTPQSPLGDASDTKQLEDRYKDTVTVDPD